MKVVSCTQDRDVDKVVLNEARRKARRPLFLTALQWRMPGVSGPLQTANTKRRRLGAV